MTMFRLLPGLLLTLVALYAGPTLAASSPHNQRFGKTLLVEHRVPEATIRKMNSFKPSAPVPGESKVVNAMLADTEDWAAPDIDGRMSGNPYTIVVLLTGTARENGDATTLWQAGWRFEAKVGGDQTRSTPLGGLSKTGVKAGEKVELTAAATPTSFKEDRKAAPVIGLVNARNLTITDIRVQVWSGLGGTSFAEMILSYRWALVGVVLVVLWWFWFRRS